MTKPLRIGSFHDQFRYTPETKNLGSVLLRYYVTFDVSPTPDVELEANAG